MNQNSNEETINAEPAVETQKDVCYTNSEFQEFHPEEDVPLNTSDFHNSTEYINNVKNQNFKVIGDAELLNCSPEGLRNIIDYHDNMDRHKYKRYGFWMIVSTLGAFMIISVIDAIILNNCEEYKQSSIIDGFIDLLKYVIPTLIGFVFADSKGTKSEDKKK